MAIAAFDPCLVILVPICNLSSLQYGTFVPLCTTSVPLTSAGLAVFSIPSRVEAFQFTNKGVKRQLEAGDPNKKRTSFCKYQKDQVPREGPAPKAQPSD